MATGVTGNYLTVYHMEMTAKETGKVLARLLLTATVEKTS